MFTTIDQVKEVTGYDVSLETIIKAQHIMTVYVGKTDTEVTSPNDRAILGRATAFQAAYMHDNPARIYEQVALTQIAQFGQAMSFRNDGATPWVAPLAVIACQRLSWKRMRSIKTGPIFYTPPTPQGWEVE